MKTLSPRPLAVAVAVLIALFVASIPAWADSGTPDEERPTVPVFLDGPQSFGTGTTPTWSWQASTAEDGMSIVKYHIRVKRDDNTWEDASPATVDAPTTSWSPSPAFSVDGIYQIMVMAEQSDGRESGWAESSTYVLDRVPPQVALIVPSVGLETNDVDIVFSGTSSDSPWGVAAVHWEVFDPDGEQVLGSSQFDEPSATFGPLSPLTVQGEYTVRLFAEDRAGNTATTAERKFRLDTSAPKMAHYELLTAKSRMLHGDLYMSDVQPRILVIADDNPNGSGFNVSGEVEIEVFTDTDPRERVDGAVSRTPNQPGLDGETWTAVWSPSGPMLSGRYYPWITIIDDAGNKLERGGPAYRFVIDSDPPEFPDDSSVATIVGKVNTGNGRQFTNSRRPVITWSAAYDPNLQSGFSGAELPGAGVAGYQLEVWTKLDGQSKPQGTKAYTAPGAVDPWVDLMPIAPTGGPVEQHTPSFDLSLKDGECYGAWILVRDRVGNMPQAGGEPKWVDPPFIFDSSPPSLPGVPAVVGAVEGRIGTTRPTITWAHATDKKEGVSQSGVAGYDVRIRREGSASWDVLTEFIELDPHEDVDCLGGDGPLDSDFEWGVPQLPGNGRYELILRARDVAGNVSPGWTDIVAFTVDTTPLDTPETPYTESPTNNRRPQWTWPAVAGAVRYGVYLGGVLQEYVLPPETPGAPLAWAPAEGAELAEGRHYLQVTAISDLGNESEKSLAGLVDIDLTSPRAPMMKALPKFTNKNEVLFEWEAEVDAVRFMLRYVIGDGDPIDVPVGVKRYSLEIPGLETLGNPEGATIKAMVIGFDLAGNANDWPEEYTVSTTIDRTGPNVRILEPTAETHTNGRRPVWRWSAEEDGTSPAKNYKVTLAPEGRAESTFWQESPEFVPVSDLASGTYILRVAARDELGNVGSEQSFPAVYVVAPTVSTPIPSPGVYPVNKVSTLAFSVHGIWDAELEMKANGRPVPEENLIVLLRSPALTKFYVFIDADMVEPGQRLTIEVKVGDMTWEFGYDVLIERSGFGFGRLRPWDW